MRRARKAAQDAEAALVIDEMGRVGLAQEVANLQLLVPQAVRSLLQNPISCKMGQADDWPVDIFITLQAMGRMRKPLFLMLYTSWCASQ